MEAILVEETANVNESDQPWVMGGRTFGAGAARPVTAPSRFSQVLGKRL